MQGLDYVLKESLKECNLPIIITIKNSGIYRQIEQIYNEFAARNLIVRLSPSYFLYIGEEKLDEIIYADYSIHALDGNSITLMENDDTPIAEITLYTDTEEIQIKVRNLDHYLNVISNLSKEDLSDSVKYLLNFMTDAIKEYLKTLQETINGYLQKLQTNDYKL